jgi:predicted membrane protein
MFLFSGFFWSGALVLLGIGIILNVFLKTKIPFVRIFFALLLIYIGVSLFFARSWRGLEWRRHHLPERVRVTDGSQKHDIVFGEGEVDLTGVKLADKVIKEEVDVAFGSCRIRLNPAMPVRVEVSSAFAEVRMPSGNEVGFGDHVYRSKDLDESQPHLVVKVDVAFGHVEVFYDRRAASPGDTVPPGKRGEL